MGFFDFLFPEKKREKAMLHIKSMLIEQLKAINNNNKIDKKLLLKLVSDKLIAHSMEWNNLKSSSKELQGIISRQFEESENLRVASMSELGFDCPIWNAAGIVGGFLASVRHTTNNYKETSLIVKSWLKENLDGNVYKTLSKDVLFYFLSVKEIESNEKFEDLIQSHIDPIYDSLNEKNSILSEEEILKHSRNVAMWWVFKTQSTREQVPDIKVSEFIKKYLEDRVKTNDIRGYNFGDFEKIFNVSNKIPDSMIDTLIADLGFDQHACEELEKRIGYKN